MINIEIINDKIAIIKIKNFDNRELYTYEVYGNKGYNISGKIIMRSHSTFMMISLTNLLRSVSHTS